MQEELAPERPSARTPAERHAAAIANSLARARAAADDGRLDDALAWLELVRAVDGPLPDAWEERRRAWQAARETVWRTGMEAG